MESVAQYIEAAKTATKSKSDSQLAMRLGISRQALHTIKRGEAFPSEDTMIALAERANLDPAEALALLGLWRSHGETKRAYERLLKLSRLSKKVFAYMIFASLAYWGNVPKSAVALDNSSFPASENFSILIIMRKLAVKLQALPSHLLEGLNAALYRRKRHSLGCRLLRNS